MFNVVAPDVTKSDPLTWYLICPASRYNLGATSDAADTLPSRSVAVPDKELVAALTHISIVNASAPNAVSALDGILI